MGNNYIYRILDINKDGIGDYHVNKYSVLIYPNPGETLESLAKDFKDNFEAYFNGTKKGGFGAGVPNLAVVKKNGEQMGSKKVYEFRLDMKSPSWLNLVTKGPINLPDLHPDYVCEVDRYEGQEVRGFSFCTLQRTNIPLKVIAISQQHFNSSLKAAESIYHWNETHVLAGRRSWTVSKHNIIQRKDIAFESDADSPAKFTVRAPGQVYMIQTAAIERYSGAAARFFGAIQDARVIVDRIWANQLVNFVRMRKHRFWSRSRKVFSPKSDALYWEPMYGCASKGVSDAVFSAKKAYGSRQKAAMYKDAMVRALVSLHPALKAQFNDWK